MRITLNLGTPSSARERYAFAWAIPVSAAAFALMIALAVVSVKDYRAYRRVQASVGGVEREEAQVRAKETALRKELEGPQLREVYRNAHFINDVIERRRFSIVELLDKVTKLLRDDVRLDGLGLSVAEKDRVVRLALSADSEEAIERFVVNLEDSSDFSDITIVSQGLSQAGPEGEEPATVSCTARYVGEP